jgi:hypothetical protein
MTAAVCLAHLEKNKHDKELTLLSTIHIHGMPCCNQVTYESSSIELLAHHFTSYGGWERQTKECHIDLDLTTKLNRDFIVSRLELSDNTSHLAQLSHTV